MASSRLDMIVEDQNQILLPYRRHNINKLGTWQILKKSMYRLFSSDTGEGEIFGEDAIKLAREGELKNEKHWNTAIKKCLGFHTKTGSGFQPTGSRSDEYIRILNPSLMIELYMAASPSPTIRDEKNLTFKMIYKGRLSF